MAWYDIVMWSNACEQFRSTWPLLTTKLPVFGDLQGRKDFEIPNFQRISRRFDTELSLQWWQATDIWYQISCGNNGKQMKNDEATYMMKYDETQRTMMKYDELWWNMMKYDIIMPHH